MKKKKIEIPKPTFREPWHGWYWTGHCEFNSIIYEDEDEDVVQYGHGPFDDFEDCRGDALIYFTAKKAAVEHQLRKIKLARED